MNTRLSPSIAPGLTRRISESRSRRAPAGAAWLLLAAGLGWLCGCAAPAPGPQAAPAAANVLRVGVTPTMPPMIFKRGAEFAGVEADLARQLAADLGKTAQFVELPWDKQIDALLKGQIDIIMSSMSITPARSMRVDFTRPYMKSGQVALARRSEAAAMQIGMFNGDCRVGSQQATTGDYFVQQEMPRVKRTTYANARAGAQAVLDKRIDVFIHDAPVNWWLASEFEAKGLTLVPAMLTQEYLAWAVRKDDPQLKGAADRFLEKVNKNGELTAAIRRWIPQWN